MFFFKKKISKWLFFLEIFGELLLLAKFNNQSYEKIIFYPVSYFINCVMFKR